VLPASLTEKYIPVHSTKTISFKGFQNDKHDRSRLHSRSNRVSLELHLYPTVKNFLATGKFKLLAKYIESKSILSILYVIDSSGSMVQGKQISFIKGLLENCLKQQQPRHLEYGGVYLYRGEALSISTFTHNEEEFLEQIRQLPAGGKTNMTAAFREVHQIIKEKKQRSREYQLFIFSDGRINAGATNDPFREAIDYYKTFLKSLKNVTVVDTEKGFVRLNRAVEFAREIQAKYLSIADEEL